METNINSLHQIRHSSDQILFWQQAIEKAKAEIEANAGKTQYIEVRLSGIKFWQGKIDLERQILNEAISEYQISTAT